MNHPISATALNKLSKTIEAGLGLHFPKERWEDLERRIGRTAKEFGFSDVESCIDWLTAASLTQEQFDVMTKHFTIGETYFFRDGTTFDFLEKRVFPEMIRLFRNNTRQLRIWVAGCSSGEEPYSIAILLHRLALAGKNRDISILATDIDSEALRKAKEGVYTEYSFRNTPAWMKENYFLKKDENHFEILPHIKQSVTFSHFNLAGVPFFPPVYNSGGINLIFCRNVLMYFSGEQAGKVVRNFHDCLADKGWLFLSAVESSLVSPSLFSRIDYSGVSFYRKERKGLDRLERSAVRAFPDTKTSKFCLENRNSQTFSDFPNIPSPKKPKNVSYSKACAAKSRGMADRGKLAEALLWNKKSLMEDKLNPLYYYLRAAIFQESGEIEKTIRALKKTLYLDPGFVLAHYSLGNLLLAEGASKEAARYFRNALTILSGKPRDEKLPGGDGITAGRLMAVISSVSGEEAGL